MTKTYNPSRHICMEGGEEKVWLRIIRKGVGNDLLIPILILVSLILLYYLCSAYHSLTGYKLYLVIRFTFCLSASWKPWGGGGGLLSVLLYPWSQKGARHIVGPDSTCWVFYVGWKTSRRSDVAALGALSTHRLLQRGSEILSWTKLLNWEIGFSLPVISCNPSAASAKLVCSPQGEN